MAPITQQRFHLAEEPSFLMSGHGRHRCDDNLGVLEFDQVMKGHAAFLLTHVVTVEDEVQISEQNVYSQKTEGSQV